MRRERRGEAQVVEMRGLAKCFRQADKVQAMSGGARPGAEAKENVPAGLAVALLTRYLYLPSTPRPLCLV